MKLPVILLASALLCSGSMHAQSAKPEKKAKAYMVADAHLDTNGIGMSKPPSKSMFGIPCPVICFC